MTLMAFILEKSKEIHVVESSINYLLEKERGAKTPLFYLNFFVLFQLLLIDSFFFPLID